MSYILLIANIKKMNLEFMVKTIKSLLTYLGHYSNRFFAAKDALLVIHLSIIYNKSEITLKNNLAKKSLTYLGYHFNYLFITKDGLYIIK